MLLLSLAFIKPEDLFFDYLIIMDLNDSWGGRDESLIRAVNNMAVTSYSRTHSIA